MPRLDTRKEQLLSFVVREHTATAEPVASEAVKDKAGLGVSPATIRNEMAALESRGYLRQPHTSAGRVPTEEGYRYYVAHCVEHKDVTEEIEAIKQNVGPGLVPGRGEGQAPALQDIEQHLKHLARELAQRLSEGVFVGFAPESTYYTGLTYLFDQPEFADVDLVRHMGEIVDNLDRIIAGLFEEVQPGVRVYVGKENPFGEQCGTVLLRMNVAQGFSPDVRPEGLSYNLLGVLGPIRMNYDRTIAMMKGIGKFVWTN